MSKRTADTPKEAKAACVQFIETIIPKEIYVLAYLAEVADPVNIIYMNSDKCVCITADDLNIVYQYWAMDIRKGSIFTDCHEISKLAEELSLDIKRNGKRSGNRLRKCTEYHIVRWQNDLDKSGQTFERLQQELLDMIDDEIYEYAKGIIARDIKKTIFINIEKVQNDSVSLNRNVDESKIDVPIKKPLAKSAKCKSDEPKSTLSKDMQLVVNALQEYDICYILEKTYDACIYRRALRFDACITIHGKEGLIEYDGRQHFVEKYHKRTKEGFLEQELRDGIKTLYCKRYCKSLLRISYDAPEKRIKEMILEFANTIVASFEPVYMYSNPILYRELMKITS